MVRQGGAAAAGEAVAGQGQQGGGGPGPGRQLPGVGGAADESGAGREGEGGGQHRAGDVLRLIKVRIKWVRELRGGRLELQPGELRPAAVLVVRV